MQRCLIDLLARESKDELADADAWLARLGMGGASRRRAPTPAARDRAGDP